PVRIPERPAEPPAPGTVGPAAAQPLPVDLDRALAADPDDVLLLVERAKRLAAGSHYAAARRDLERALRREPEHVDALAALGLLLSRRGLWSEAAPLLARAAELDPGRATTWYHLGNALNRANDLHGALAA